MVLKFPRFWRTYATHQLVDPDVPIFFQHPGFNTCVHLLLRLDHAFTQPFLDLSLTSVILMRHPQRICETTYLITPIHTAFFLHISPVRFAFFNCSRSCFDFLRVAAIVLQASSNVLLVTITLSIARTCSLCASVESFCEKFVNNCTQVF